MEEKNEHYREIIIEIRVHVWFLQLFDMDRYFDSAVYRCLFQAMRLFPTTI